MDIAYSVLTLAFLVSVGVWCREVLKEEVRGLSEDRKNAPLD